MKIRKLEPCEFARAIRNGLGSAFLHIHEYGDDGLEDELAYACTNNLVYERQSDNWRHTWLSRMLTNTGRIDLYAEKIRETFESLPEDQADLHQLVWLAVELYELGFDSFRQILLDLIEQAANSFDCDAAIFPALINVAGLKGLSISAKWLVKMHPDDAYAMLDLFDHACDVLDEWAVSAYFEKHTATDDSLKTFTESVEAEKLKKDLPSEPYQSPVPPTLSEVIELVKSAKDFKHIRGLMQFGKRASASEIDEIYRRLERERDPFKQNAYLECFRVQPLPRVTNELLPMLDSDHDRVRFHAISSISRSKSQLVRELALSRIATENERDISTGIGLLRANYEPADAASIHSAMVKIKNPDLIDAVVRVMLDIAEQHPGKILTESWLWLFEFGPCGSCRSSILKQLVKHNVAPAQLLLEARWDANFEVRGIARGTPCDNQ